MAATLRKAKLMTLRCLDYGDSLEHLLTCSYSDIKKSRDQLFTDIHGKIILFFFNNNRPPDVLSLG